MAVYTGITGTELSNWLSDYPVGPLLEFQGIASGIENTNYFVSTRDGRYVLTLFEKLTARELPFYLDLMAHLAVRGIPCPHPVANGRQQFLGALNGKPACLVSRLPGKSLTHPAAADCAAVGDMLGRMHRAAHDFPRRMPNPRAADWRARTAPLMIPFLAPDDASLLLSEVAFHGQHTLEHLPQGVIHADLFRDNVLFDHAEISGVIDFYFACNDSLLYDLAITVNDWCMDDSGALNPPRAQALLRAYHEVRTLQPEEYLAWPVALRAAALRFWLSRLHDLHLPRDGELTHAHNPDQFKRILQRHMDAGENTVWL